MLILGISRKDNGQEEHPRGQSQGPQRRVNKQVPPTEQEHGLRKNLHHVPGREPSQHLPSRIPHCYGPVTAKDRSLKIAFVAYLFSEDES